MRLDEREVQALVLEVLKRLGSSPGGGPQFSPPPAPPPPSLTGFVHPSVDAAVESARKAQSIFQEMGLESRRRIVAAMRKAGIDHAEPLAKTAQAETGLGRWRDKVKKNLLAAEKTPGVEDLQPVQAYTGDKGLTLVEYAPFGVVACVTPSTNPTATVINNSISVLSAGNAVVFAPHPAARNCCREAMRLLEEAARAAGAPAGLINTFDPASQENTALLLRHPGVDMTMVTGGPAIVKLAMSAGAVRKTICAGPGNPPVIVDESADPAAAAAGLVAGASFDNCVLCTGEKEVIVTEAARPGLLAELRRHPQAHELTRSQIDELAGNVFRVEPGGETVLNRDFVGKDAAWIARSLGIHLPDTVLLLWGEVPNDHAFVWVEQLMPVLPVTSAPDIDAAIDLARRAEGGNHHTASIYSLRVDHITKAARRLACSVFVKNGPNFMGLGAGEGFATMSIGTPTGDGLTKPRNFSRPLHCSMVGYLRIA